MPQDPDDVLLGVPIDKMDLGKGWVALEIPTHTNGDEVKEEDDDDDDAGGGGVSKKKKGRPKKMVNGIGGGGKGGNKSVLNASPAGAGLKDGGVLAFRFRGRGEEEDEDGAEWDVVVGSVEDGPAEEGED